MKTIKTNSWIGSFGRLNIHSPNQNPPDIKNKQHAVSMAKYLFIKNSK